MYDFFRENFCFHLKEITKCFGKGNDMNNLLLYSEC